MSKDQAIGGIIFVVCFLIAVFYVVTLFYPQWLATLGIQLTQSTTRFWTIAVPVVIAFVAIMAIGA